jgi:ubiquinone/menaquinone biosynthesis C-methylase UbiE
VPTPDSAWLIGEFRAFERSLALRAAIELDLFTRIGAGVDTIGALAKACRASQRGLRVLCDHLAIQGHLVKRGARYTLALHARLYLTTASPAYLGSAVKFFADDSTVAAFCGLRRSVKRGAAPRAKADWIEYARSMAPIAQPVAEFVATALKLKRDAPLQVLDIAAGHGLYGLAIAAKYSAAEIFALDSRAVLRTARKNARQTGLAERFHPIPGDAFKTGFGGPYDLVLTANFAHHLDESENIRLFRKSRAALKPAGQMVVIDFVLHPDRVSPLPDASFALTLLATSAHGNLYTFREYSNMLRTAGFRRVRQANQRGLGRCMLIASR